jgi:hypothetical protein
MTKEDFLGTWMLRRCYEEHDGRIANAESLGARPSGCIHYLGDGRMAVLIQYGGRPRLSDVPARASDAEVAAVARKFYAYAGPYTIEGNRIVHHLDTCSNPNDVGADYVRTVQFIDDRLVLGTPPVERNGVVVELKLEWQAVPPRSQMIAPS